MNDMTSWVWFESMFFLLVNSDGSYTFDVQGNVPIHLNHWLVHLDTIFFGCAYIFMFLKKTLSIESCLKSDAQIERPLQ